MKYFLGAMSLVAAMTLPALAHTNSYEGARERPAGQQVYDLDGTRVGRVDAFISAGGTPAAIVTPSRHFGGPSRRLLVPKDDLGLRADDGMLLALTDSSVDELRSYAPGQRLPVIM